MTSLDLVLVSRLRVDLVGAGYTVDGVTRALGPVASGALHREQALPALRLTEHSDEPVLVLVRLFTLGRPVARGRVDAALPRVGAAGLVGLGLARLTADPHGSEQVQAVLDLRPYSDGEHDWWLASDLGEMALGRELPVDHVLGIGGASTTLASWTPRPEVARALDLGTGCGIQALHLSQHCGHVVATDISERALRIAALNAALDEVHWQLLCGSLLEPVTGRFGLVVSNPPFVITPRVDGVPRYEYRDGGRRGDRLVREVVEGLPAVLEEGGIACLLANWEIRRGQTWQDAVRGLVGGVGLDAWVVQREQQDPAEYAELWARDGGSTSGTQTFEAMYAAWLDDFASREVDRIGFGVVVLQRPVGGRAPFEDLTDHRGPVAAPMGPHVLAGLRARTRLAEHPDELVTTPWRCAPDVTEERFGRPGAPDPAVIRVRQGGGLGIARSVGTAMAAYLSVADGSMTPAQALPAIAHLLDRDAGEVAAECLPVIADLVRDGLLVP